MIDPLATPAGVADALAIRAKGYDGPLRRLLRRAAEIITEYQKERPFDDLLTEHAAALALVGYRDAIEVALKMGAIDVAAAIRNRAAGLVEPEA